MKRLLSPTLAVALWSCALLACDGGSPATPEPAGPVPAPAVEPEPPPGAGETPVPAGPDDAGATAPDDASAPGEEGDAGPADAAVEPPPVEPPPVEPPPAVVPAYCAELLAALAALPSGAPGSEERILQLQGCPGAPSEVAVLEPLLPPVSLAEVATHTAKPQWQACPANGDFDASNPCVAPYLAFVDSHPGLGVDVQALLEQGGYGPDEDWLPYDAPFEELHERFLDAIGITDLLAELRDQPVGATHTPWKREAWKVGDVELQVEHTTIRLYHPLLGWQEMMAFRPADLARETRLPGVLLGHGHEFPAARFDDHDADHPGGLYQWAREFFAPDLVADHVVFIGTKRAYASGVENEISLMLLEKTDTPLLGLMTLELMAQLAVMQAFPCVDAGQVEAWGHSGGGHVLTSLSIVLPHLPVLVDYGLGVWSSQMDLSDVHCELVPRALLLIEPLSVGVSRPGAYAKIPYYYKQSGPPYSPHQPAAARAFARAFFDAGLLDPTDGEPAAP